MILSAICTGLMSVALAEDAPTSEPLELPIDETPLVLEIPRDEKGFTEWTFAMFPEPGIEIALSRYAPPPVAVGFGWRELFQPDIAGISVEQAQAFLTRMLDREPDTITDFALTPAPDHPVLGKMVYAEFMATLPPESIVPLEDEGGEEEEDGTGATPDGEAPPAPQPILLKQRGVLYATEGGLGYAIAGAPLPWDEEARAEALAAAPGEDGAIADLSVVLDEVFAMATINSPAVAAEELATGTFEAGAGYTLDIPDGWRALTDKEMNFYAPERVSDGPFEGRRAARIFVDPTTIEPVAHFSCQVYSSASRPIEVLDPAKSAAHGENYQIHVRASLKGKSFKVTSGGVEETLRMSLPMQIEPVLIDEAEAGELRLVSMGDRDGYHWTVPATRGEGDAAEPVTVSAYYTAWDNLGLNCFAIAGEGQEEVLERFNEAMGTFTLRDSDEHPMVLSFMSRYRRWWPYTHPAMQLYWLAIPLFLLALVPMARDWFESRS